MDARLTAALAVSRIASALTRKLDLGGGTVLPGHVASWIDPQALQKLSSRLSQGAVLISGTNGKTTTARMLASIAMAAGLTPVHNRAGANLPAGVVSALASHTSLAGRSTGDLGVFEVDEAHVTAVAAATRPRVLVLTNLFRDQLDRYGEVDFVARTWESAIARLEPSSTLVVNVDDPVLPWLAQQAPGRSLTFGVMDRSIGGARLPHEADRRLCPRCGARLRYAWCYYGHLGDYRCEACGWERPPPELVATSLQLQDQRAQLTLVYQGHAVQARAPLGGLHTVYNLAAAGAAAVALGIDWPAIVAGLAATQGAFGRQERIPIEAGSLTLTLVKNPVGFNQALRTLPNGQELLVAINDRFADGTDISWLWDVDFELLALHPPRILCTGLRAHDMAVRLKYAGLEDVEVQPDLARALDQTLTRCREGSSVGALCTYTATLEIRRLLHRSGLVAPFWEN